MSAATILAIINALFDAAPQLLALYDQVKGGTPVTEAQVTAALSQYNALRAQLTSDI